MWLGPDLHFICSYHIDGSYIVAADDFVLGLQHAWPAKKISLSIKRLSFLVGCLVGDYVRFFYRCQAARKITFY